MCFFHTQDLVDIEVSPDNKHFSYIEDKYLLDKFAFADCDKLKTIVFPKSVKSFGLRCFYYSYRLQFVQFLGEKVCIDSDCFEY